MTSSDPSSRQKLLSLVVPIYNDAGCVEPFISRVTPILDDIRKSFSFAHEILFVVDPSTDGTEEKILSVRRNNDAVKLITLSRRFGQQPAILAGLFNCRGDICIILDVDLQDPPELMRAMVEKNVVENYNVVYAIRKKRHKDEPLLKRWITEAGYYLMNKLSSIDIPRNVGDFRLVDRRVIEELRKLDERHAFFRGLVPLVGFRQTGITFDREDRVTGTTKYNYYWGSITNGVNALVCFSNKLLNLSSVIGVIFFFLSIVISLAVIYIRLFTDIPIQNGVPTIVVVVFFTSGIQALLLGILGSYVGRIYDETKHRPIFIIDRKEGL